MERWSRDGCGKLTAEWFYHRGDVIQVSGLGIELPLAEIYDRMDVPDGLLLRPPAENTA